MSIELRALIREVIADHPQADPRKLARHTAEATPEGNLMGFYEEALVDYAASMLRTARNNALDAIPKPGSNGNYSKKLERCRNGWSVLCDQQVHVGNKEWKALGYCTVADMRFCAQERFDQAARDIARGHEYNRFADLMEQQKVALFMELSPEVLG